MHAGMHTRAKVGSHYIDSEEIERRAATRLGPWMPCSFLAASASAGTEGKIAAIRYARENKVPYLGICLGMQLAVIEFARDVAGLKAPIAPSSIPRDRTRWSA